MELKGNVFNVIFRNADNGYSVVELSSNGRLITANFRPLPRDKTSCSRAVILSIPNSDNNSPQPILR